MSVVTTWLPQTLRAPLHTVNAWWMSASSPRRNLSMGSRWTDWPAEISATLRRGTVIPAHPLALDADRKLDARRQRALSRYYLDAGAGGLAVGVHTTQFAIREAGLFEEVLTIAAETARDWPRLGRLRDAPRPLLVAGACGRTQQARTEARLARGL